MIFQGCSSDTHEILTGVAGETNLALCIDQHQVVRARGDQRVADLLNIRLHVDDDRAHGVVDELG